MRYGGPVVPRTNSSAGRTTRRRVRRPAMRASSSSKPVAPSSSASRATVVRGGSSARAFQESDPLNASDMTVNYFTSYAFAHIYAFADWFSWYTGGEYSQVYTRYDLSYGVLHIHPLFNLAGYSHDLPHGVYDEFFRYEGVLGTNIYTHYRGLIIDFVP